MPIQRLQMQDDDGTGQTGTILNNAWLQTIYGQIDGAHAWVDVPYSAGIYSAQGATWTVPAAAHATLMYAVSGHTVSVAFMISGSQSLSASVVQLFVHLPPEVPTILRAGYIPFTYYANGGGTGAVELGFGARQLTLMRDLAGTPWPVMTNATGIYSGTITYRYA